MHIISIFCLMGRIRPIKRLRRWGRLRVLRRPINVSPGSLASIGLTEFDYQYMPEPYGDCSSLVKNNEDYSLYKCMKDCYMDAIIAECKCRPHYMKKGDYSVVPECTFADYSNCQIKVTQVKERTKLAEDCNCVQPCYAHEYEADVTYTTFPSEQMDADTFKIKFPLVYNDLKHGIDDDEYTSGWGRDGLLKRNLLGLNIYFKDLKKVKVVESEADKMPSLIADLGGTFGLWLGMSIVTIVEIIYCFLTCLPKTIIYIIKGEKSSKKVEVLS